MLIVDRYRERWPKAHIASAVGITRKCASRWIRRCENDGVAGLHEKVTTTLDAGADQCGDRAERGRISKVERRGQDRIGPRICADLGITQSLSTPLRLCRKGKFERTFPGPPNGARVSARVRHQR
ncbi:helix-turn-helix domain-containing protein [Rhodococcus oxybenzonivorans]|uniref:helix-turn-helix domain-containing protein n=1 Tax=Rhodococcus TaxID=1827 RepID=UPI0037C81962